jgi:hypothetical protein
MAVEHVLAMAALAVPLWMQAVGTLIAWASGHFALLHRFPPIDEPCETWRFASGRGPWMVNFKHALHVGIGARGLHLAPHFMFRPWIAFRIPCVPWSDIEDLGAYSFLFRHGRRFRIRATGHEWLLFGDAAEAVRAHASASSTRG